MARSIAIVFADDFSAQLEKLSFHTPVWLADTAANHAAAEEAWQRAVEWPHISVTLFRAPAAKATRDDWRALLDQITLRERSIDAVEVIGAPLALPARAAFADAGYERFEETAGGFRVRR
jgi:hypothetical protein